MAESHVPVLLAPLLRAVAPVSGVWLDGTFGAGGYSRGLLCLAPPTGGTSHRRGTILAYRFVIIFFFTR